MFGAFGTPAAAATVPQVQRGPLYAKINDHKKAYAPYSCHPPNTREVEYFSDDKDKKDRGQMQFSQGHPAIGDNYDCRFQADFYDRKGPESAYMGMQYHDARADDDNPDPENLVPVTIYGIEHLLKRYDNCVADSKKLREDIEGDMGLQRTITLLSEHEMEQREDVDRMKRKQGEQYGRMLHLLAKIEKLRMQDKPLEMDEYRFREKAEGMMQQLKTQHAQLTELLNFQSQHDLVRDEYVDSLSEADLEVLYSAMARQHEGLQHVSDILERDVRDVQIVRRNLSSHHHHPSR